jgi:cytoskeletal protein RodZ
VTEISQRLRTAREAAGLSIEDIAAATKIRVSALQAMERGQFERLPGDFYARAFLKAYAREVRLPPDEIVHEYDASRPVAQPQPDSSVSRPERERNAERAKVAPRPRAPHLALPSLWPLILSLPRNAGVVVAFALVLLVTTLVRNRPAGERAPEQGAVGTSGAVEAPSVPLAAAPRPEAAPEKLTLEIHPSGPTWVTGAADGTRILYRLIAPGEHVTVEARNDLTFRIGNAAAFSYTINGLPGKPLGGPDEVREFRITRENYRSFGR